MDLESRRGTLTIRDRALPRNVAAGGVACEPGVACITSPYLGKHTDSVIDKAGNPTLVTRTSCNSGR